MLRRMKRVFLGLMLLCAWAAAEEEARLPQAVLELSESVHPGYTIAAHDGWGDESRGQFALILKQGNDNILCIAEKTEEDAAYQMTVDNTNAVYDGDRIPSLLIDLADRSIIMPLSRTESGLTWIQFCTNGSAETCAVCIAAYGTGICTIGNMKRMRTKISFKAGTMRPFP